MFSVAGEASVAKRAEGFRVSPGFHLLLKVRLEQKCVLLFDKIFLIRSRIILRIPLTTVRIY